MSMRWLRIKLQQAEETYQLGEIFWLFRKTRQYLTWSIFGLLNCVLGAETVSLGKDILLHEYYSCTSHWQTLASVGCFFQSKRHKYLFLEEWWSCKSLFSTQVSKPSLCFGEDRVLVGLLEAVEGIISHLPRCANIEVYSVQGMQYITMFSFILRQVCH